MFDQVIAEAVKTLIVIIIGVPILYIILKKVLNGKAVVEQAAIGDHVLKVVTKEEYERRKKLAEEILSKVPDLDYKIKQILIEAIITTSLDKLEELAEKARRLKVDLKRKSGCLFLQIGDEEYHLRV